MATADQRTRQGVVVSFVRDVGLVRTVRQVAAVTARQVGAKDSVVEQVRLAVGEACGVLLAAYDGPPDPTPQDRIELTIEAAPRLRVSVSCKGLEVPAQRDPDWRDPWILLRGLVHGAVVREDGDRISVEMSWPR